MISPGCSRTSHHIVLGSFTTLYLPGGPFVSFGVRAPWGHISLHCCIVQGDSAGALGNEATAVANTVKIFILGRNKTGTPQNVVDCSSFVTHQHCSRSTRSATFCSFDNHLSEDGFGALFFFLPKDQGPQPV